jgi:hypothetical protein
MNRAFKFFSLNNFFKNIIFNRFYNPLAIFIKTFVIMCGGTERDTVKVKVG